MIASDKKITIIVHSSDFHTDDVFGVATLMLFLGEKPDIRVIRTRDAKIIEKGDYVLDVGGTYDQDKNRFDHHQIGGAGARINGISYASFGLVWKKFGEVLAGSKEGAERIDKMIVQPIDAVDNGFQFMETKIPDLYPFDIGYMTNCFKPTWKEGDNIDEVFIKLVSYAKVILTRLITIISDSLEAERFVLDSYNNAKDKRLIETNHNYPWLEVMSKLPEPLFVYYENLDGNWTLKNVRSNLFSYEPRKKLPESWAGKRDKELEKTTGVPGAIFCHNARFMAVAKTKEAILKMAQIALDS